jgi:hypothetical protein
MDSCGVAKFLAPRRVINPIQLFLLRAVRLFHCPDSWAEIAARKTGSILYWRPACTKTCPYPIGTFFSNCAGSTVRNVRKFSSAAWSDSWRPTARTKPISQFFTETAFFDEELKFRKRIIHFASEFASLHGALPVVKKCPGVARASRPSMLQQKRRTRRPSHSTAAEKLRRWRGVACNAREARSCEQLPPAPMPYTGSASRVRLALSFDSV